MTTKPNVHFLLSIWRDFAPTLPLVMQHDESGWRGITRDSGLQEEVYSWPLPRDPFGCVEDDDVRDDLRRALLERLRVSLPPRQRRIEVLREFVAKAEQAIGAGYAGPQPSDSPSAGSPTHTPSEPNPLLALALHLKWLVRCFGDRPGVSVSIR